MQDNFIQQQNIKSIEGVNMSFSFSQSSGKLCNDQTGKCAQGYSGNKGETDQTKKNAGPLPQGKYTVDNSCGGSGQRCNLTPDASNNMFGRSAFQVHGDNKKGDNSASQGCIILGQSDRAGLKKGDTIHVKK